MTSRRRFLQVIDDMAKNPPTEEEVNRGQDASRSRSSICGCAIPNGWVCSSASTSRRATGDWRSSRATGWRSATTAEVDQFARTYLRSPTGRSAVFIPTEKPERAEVPATPDVDGDGEGLQGRDRRSRRAKRSTRARQTSTSEPSAAELQPGIKLALLSKKTRGAS